jgi:hypothetical protein
VSPPAVIGIDDIDRERLRRRLQDIVICFGCSDRATVGHRPPVVRQPALTDCQAEEPPIRQGHAQPPTTGASRGTVPISTAPPRRS